MPIENNEFDFTVKNGIEKCEDLCKCGSNLRLHTFVFGVKNQKLKARFYVDCQKCRIASEWHNTTDEAIEDFDRCMNTPEPESYIPLEDLELSPEELAEANESVSEQLIIC